MKTSFFAAGAALLALTACGGGGAATLGGGGFSGLQSEYDNGVALDALYSTTASLPTVNADLTYNGVVVVGDDFGAAGDAFIGDATFTVNFDADTMSGTASDFIYAQRSSSGPRPTTALGDATGTLEFTNGSVSGFVAMDVDGSLTFSGNTLMISDTIGGAFQGPNAELYEETVADVAASGDFNDGDVDMQIYAVRQ